MSAVSNSGSSSGFDEIVSTASPQVRDLALRTRALIREVLPEVVEVPWPRQRIIGYGVGPKKMSEHFGYISVQKEYLNLGFNYGSRLPDPQGLLEGTGELMRHVKIRETVTLVNPAIKQLLQAAIEERRAALTASKSSG